MFKHTFASVNLIKRELSFFAFLVTVFSTLFTVSFLIASIAIGRGYTWLNVLLLVLVSLNFAVYALIRMNGTKEIRKISLHVYRITKILLGFIPLAVVIFSLAFTSAELSRIELVFLPLILLMWMMQVVFEISSIYVDSRLVIFADAIKMDVEGVVNPLLKIRNAINGESYRNDDIHVSDKSRKKLADELERAAENEDPQQQEEIPTQKDDFFTRLSKTKEAIRELIKK
ncbi:MAG: hypothetical protein IKV16_05170 [Clostridia bacterium]|nr:hypothetical protein [Clostridia bacterium]